MKINFNYILFFILASTLFRCVPPEEEVLTEVTRNLKDSTLQKIIVYQDQQLTDSLTAFFKHKDPSYRYAAAMAFGSTKDKNALDSLIPLLKDPIQEVRIAAAYAIGQLGDERGTTPLMNAFEQYDTARQFVKSNSTILEAVGKIGSKETLDLLANISTYKATDTLLLEGQAYGIYRFGLRDVVSPAGTSKILSFANNPIYPLKVRMIAANYLGRIKDIDITNNVQAIHETLQTESAPYIRMALATALKKVKTPEATRALLQQFENETDYRVKVNIIRALEGANYDSVNTTLLTVLNDDNVPVAQTAAQFFVNNGVPQQAANYYRMARNDYPWQVKIALLEAANKHLPAYMADTKGGINATLRRNFLSSSNTAEKAAILRAMGNFGWNYQFMLEQAANLTTPMEKTALVSSVGRIVRNPDFDKVFGVSRRRVARALSHYLVDVFKEGDLGRVSMATGILDSIGDNFKPVLLDSLPVLITAQQQLPLPRATGTYNRLQKVIDYLQGTTTPEKENTSTYEHPIDLELLNRVTNSAAAVMQTDRGKIRLELYPLLAPGTVVNFIELAESGFFKDKNFHRVVPNFVIQGGCPRGDGWGSLGYSIRSELPLAYYNEEGYVGMASSGNHTEGTQFFITHSPTPHLDGNYTIFAKVTEGMDAVHQMEVGDKIQSVAIRY